MAKKSRSCFDKVLINFHQGQSHKTRVEIIGAALSEIIAEKCDGHEDYILDAVI